MTHYPDLPFGSYHSFIKAMIEIVEEKLPECSFTIKKLQDKPSPGTEFGVRGLNLGQTDFKTLVEKLNECAELSIHADEPGITVGVLYRLYLQEKHRREWDMVRTQMYPAEENSGE